MCRCFFDIIKYIFLFFVFSACNSVQEFEDYLIGLNDIPPAERSQALKKYLSRFDSFPIIKDTTVYFILKESQEVPVYLTGDMNKWQSKTIPMLKIIGTDYYYCKQNYPLDARIEYKYIVNENFMLDSLNQLKSLGGFGYNSLILMPDYEFPDEVLGKRLMEYTRIDTIKFESNILRNRREVYFYDHPLAKSTSPLLIMLDGKDYLELANANVILDNLISANKIPALKAIFVNPLDRMQEFRFDDEFGEMIFNELIPFLRKKHSLTDNDIYMGGVSLGAVAAFFAMKNYNEKLSGCFSQSGAFWIDSLKILAELRETELSDKAFFLSYGTYERQDSVHTVLTKFLKGKQVNYKLKKYNEGHNWGNWKAHLDDALKYILVEGKDL